MHLAFLMVECEMNAKSILTSPGVGHILYDNILCIPTDCSATKIMANQLFK